MRRAVLLLSVLLIGAAPDARAAAPDPCTGGTVNQELSPTTNILGTVGLYFRSAPGAEVSFYECVGGQATLLGKRTDPSETTFMNPAAWWRCDRLVRHFAATATVADGTPVLARTAIRTGSCSHRLALRAPAQVARGAMARVRVFDRWNEGGVRAKLCVTPPGGVERCRPVELAPAVNVATVHLRLRRSGDWQLRLITPWKHLRETIAVGAGAPPARRLPDVLATGDSMMLGTDSFLTDDLDGTADVTSDVHPGTSISQTDEWSTLSPGQARRVRPKVTVLFIGANEGYDMTTPAGERRLCCDQAWADEFRRRLEGSLRDYLRVGRVLLLTLPIAKDPDRAQINAWVNGAYLRAADDLGNRVAVLRLDRFFTPNGYRASMRYRGRRVRIRLHDEVHLSVAGTAIAARLVTQKLSRLGWLR